MEGSLQAADFSDTGVQKLIPWYGHSCLIPAVTTLRSSLSIYIFFLYNTGFFFLVACFVNSSPEVTF
jgi:hypothetical protein